jgi:hypothetical protein
MVWVYRRVVSVEGLALADVRAKRAAGIEQRLGAFVDVVSVGIQPVCCRRVVRAVFGPR